MRRPGYAPPGEIGDPPPPALVEPRPILLYSRLLPDRLERAHVESITSPKEALRLLESEAYDCVVSDFQMPSLNGIDLARRVRETSEIPFILYTGRGSEEVAETAFTVGVDDYIHKEMPPSHYQVLTRRIRVAVEKHRAERALNKQIEEMQLILYTMPTTIWFRDTENRILRVNKAAADSVGLTVEDIEGSSAYELFPEELLYILLEQ